VAYIVPGPGGPIRASEVRAYLKKKLPEYMIPSFFVVLEKLPLNFNGKLDREALPAPSSAPPESEQDYEAAATITEKLLSDIWAEVLHVKKVSVLDNFFDFPRASRIGSGFTAAHSF
jgi:hypothetical protein